MLVLGMQVLPNVILVLSSECITLTISHSGGISSIWGRWPHRCFTPCVSCMAMAAGLGQVGLWRVRKMKIHPRRYVSRLASENLLCLLHCFWFDVNLRHRFHVCSFALTRIGFMSFCRYNFSGGCDLPTSHHLNRVFGDLSKIKTFLK